MPTAVRTPSKSGTTSSVLMTAHVSGSREVKLDPRAFANDAVRATARVDRESRRIRWWCQCG
jgi:hypothetical protein